MCNEIAAKLREHAEWAESNIWEVPITLPDDLKKAADAIEKLMAENKRLRSKIRDMKSSASWDEDIRRGQVQGMW